MGPKSTSNKKARFLYEEAADYKGHRRVRDMKKRARRVERRASKRQKTEE